MSDEWATSLSVTAAAHEEFVALSGDSNPLHTDPVAARRLPFGRVALHGVHLALLALDHLADHDPRSPTRIRCTFRHPVGPGDELRIRCSRTGPDQCAIVVEHDVWKVADLHVELGAAAPPASGGPSIPSPEASAPREPTAAELVSLRGSIRTRADMAVVRSQFARAVTTLGERGVAELVTLTRLVGMHVPGLHSMFSSFDLGFGAASASASELAYDVRRFDERFSKVTIDVAASSLHGTVVAFVRPPPTEATVGDTHPSPHAFEAQRWLVIGGSRGLGATASLLLAEGGADVRLTYRSGAEDAHRIATDAGAATYALDVADPAVGIGRVTADGWTPTHLAYFASPPIFDGMPGVYSRRLEARFRAVYVDAFAAVLDLVDVSRLRGVLWPSSTAVERPVAGLAEYAAAKRAGEEFCERLRARHPDLRLATPRFPRLATDQTASFVPTDTGDAAGPVLDALLTFSG